MAKFDFQLEGVLRYRKNREQMRQRELSVVQAELARLQGQLTALDESVKAANEDMRRNHLTGKLDLSFMAAHRRFLVGTQMRAMELVQKMAGVNRQVEEARRNLAAAAKDRKVMEKLKERQQTRWAAELARKETAEMDEIGMQLGFENLRRLEQEAE